MTITLTRYGYGVRTMSRAITVDAAFKIISPIQVSVVELVDIIKELASQVRALETRVNELERHKHIIIGSSSPC